MDSISGITSAVALGISIILLLATWGWLQQGKGDNKTHYYLLALLAVICLQLCELIYHSFNLHRQWPALIKVVDPLVVMAPLLLFAYIKGLKRQVVSFSGWGLLHFFPGIYVLAWDIPFWFLSGEDKVNYMEQGFLESEPWTFFVPYRSDYLLILASLILFYWWQVKALVSAKSGPVSHLDLFIRRVRQAMLLLAAGMILCAFTGYGRGTNIVLSIGAGILVGYLCYFFLLQVKMPKAFMLESYSNNNSDMTDASDKGSSNDNGIADFNPSETQLAFQTLAKQLKLGLFQDNELSLAKLAEASSLNVHLASKAINECSGGNFYDWVNSYRVEKTKDLLLSSDEQITHICYEVGFNSKSTFYSAFKKVTGLTPGGYRKANLKK